MSFKSVDEIENFRFDDCQIASFKVESECIRLELEALIVKSNNSQNTNFTESYAGTVIARFMGGRILKGIKDGFKLYDANENLIKEVEDTKLDEEEIKSFPKLCEGAYLYRVDRADKDIKDDEEKSGSAEHHKQHYILSIEFADEEESAMGDSYQLDIVFDKAVFEWERYMNRVQD
jgi:hypothetical protein